MEQAILRGHEEEAVGFLRRGWEPMLSTGTTWEDFDWNEESGLSACHAWTAHPSFHLVNALAGVFQTGPAWSSVELRPAFLESVDHASALVASPRGDIRSAWRRVGGDSVTWEVTIPEGVSATVRLATGARLLPGGAGETALAPGDHLLPVEVNAR